jgi:sugar phosphate isomerase/epimerase
MLAQTVRRCADSGIVVLDVEAIRLTGPATTRAPAGAPGTAPAAATTPADPAAPGAATVPADPGAADGWGPVLETAAALGARYVNAICAGPDLDRLADAFAALTEAALPYGVRPVVEFMSYLPVRTLAAAVRIAARSRGGQILVDALHAQRCGVTPEDLAAVDPALIAYLQLCDAPRRPPPDLIGEARSARLLPGAGELPLRELIAALPPRIPIAVEAPDAAEDARQAPAERAAAAHRSLSAVLGQDSQNSQDTENSQDSQDTREHT